MIIVTVVFYFQYFNTLIYLLLMSTGSDSNLNFSIRNRSIVRSFHGLRRRLESGGPKRKFNNHNKRF